MTYKTTIEQTVFRFDDLKTLLAKATPERSGDQLAGIAADGPVERLAAQMALADLPLKAFLNDELIPADDDEVSRLILDQHDPRAFDAISTLTVGELREWMLRPETTQDRLEAVCWGLTPEMVAAVSKIMRLQDMIAVSAKRRVVTRFRNTVGLGGRLSTRNQPNHPIDDSRGIIASAIDGLLMGSGDAVIGVNPATDSTEDYIRIVSLLDELREKLAIPTQTCCLGHVTTAIAAMERHAPVDLVFQSVAGSEKANRGFGVDLALLRQAHDAGRSLNRGMPGANIMYFETGQGAALSADAHFGIDQQTMEARAYAVAREFNPMLVNTVVGFIGPEYLFNGKQIIRAGIEDHFCGKMLGLPMGVDVCYTNHADADQEDMDTLLTLLCAANVNFVITVPGADDIMLNYQSLSHHDAVYCRETLKRQPAPEFQTWLAEIGLTDCDGTLVGEPAVLSNYMRSSALIGAYDDKGN
ncbi:ethanolamine ammonia-lyase subunit EutB [Rhizobium sp. Leaf341]|uniref:ethanolamine ammonia-lyase subunit EutB n=1 Tax=Rhizobium sp. Leaf341 TaxID=1736344 RepID=UPI0007159255|nr:ethanolamine ammonia-lyase subunit EutB [Rhizobium sp. Leaf341]KQR71695.1 ethanolamine ammonia-lyase [Rhizobium sp. Leaf341]